MLEGGEVKINQKYELSQKSANFKHLLGLVSPRLHLLEQVAPNIKATRICFQEQIRVILWYLPSLNNEDDNLVFVRAYKGPSLIRTL